MKQRGLRTEPASTGVFRIQKGPWCQLDQAGKRRHPISGDRGGRTGPVRSALGHEKSPLVEAGWTEADCRRWCEENNLLSPIYKTATRGGCWFCHNQRVDQLRLLRKNYPEYWALMLKWDADSPVTFKPDGHTVHDFKRRFALEDQGFLIPGDPKFKWRMLDENLQMNMIF